MFEQYLSKRHKYGEFDCILLAKEFYQQELGKDFELPSYPNSKRWMKELSKEFINRWAEKYAVQIPLTKAENYDLLVFSSSEHIIHFGIFLAPSRMLHIEEGQVSKIDTISSYWLEQLHAVYRLV